MGFHYEAKRVVFKQGSQLCGGAQNLLCWVMAQCGYRPVALEVFISILPLGTTTLFSPDPRGLSSQMLFCRKHLHHFGVKERESARTKSAAAEP